MWQICFTIGGVRHCIPIPLLIKREDIIHPPPPNYPELDLAVTVLELVRAVQPVVKTSDLLKQLTDVSNRFIQQVQKDLPKGVELHEGKAAIA